MFQYLHDEGITHRDLKVSIVRWYWDAFTRYTAYNVLVCIFLWYCNCFLIIFSLKIFYWQLKKMKPWSRLVWHKSWKPLHINNHHTCYYIIFRLLLLVEVNLFFINLFTLCTVLTFTFISTAEFFSQPINIFLFIIVYIHIRWQTLVCPSLWMQAPWWRRSVGRPPTWPLRFCWLWGWVHTPRQSTAGV